MEILEEALCAGGGRGIRLRKLEEVQSSLFLKFGWNVLSQDSLWLNFFRAKFVKKCHVSLCTEEHTGSSFWKRIVEGLPVILQNSHWKIRNG